MGTNQSTGRSRSSVASESGMVVKSRQVREHKRFGTVTVKITNMAANRRPQDNIITHTITPKGSILYGSLCNAVAIQKALGASGYPVLPPGEISLPDSRAHKLLVTYCNGWHAIPFPEVFSRHSGTCLILGDRNITSPPFSVKVGDCFRLGSVGLVVSELKIPNKDEERLDAKTLQFLKDEALAFDTQEDMATLALDEENQLNRESVEELQASPEKEALREEARKMSFDGSGLTNGERFICYMCYETHNTDDDALVAPCDCRGDTRYLHVQCLQKWYQSSVCGSQAQVIRTTGNGAPACKICGAAYKSAFRRADGRKASLLEVDSVGPYLSLVVVTKHDSNPGLFNTKFRLNFGRHANTPPNVTDEEANTIVIGRSSSCTMILDYRTVSTVHAKINYSDGKFYLTDKRSSNGTMVYLQDPLPLSYSSTLKFRMGRTTLSIQARRGWTSTLRSALGVGQHIESQQSGPSASDLHNLLIDCRNSSIHKREQMAASEGNNNNFLTGRSFTIRTFNNDNNSLNGDDRGGREHPQYYVDENGNIIDIGGAGGGGLLGGDNESEDGVRSLNSSPPMRMRFGSVGSALSNIAEREVLPSDLAEFSSAARGGFSPRGVGDGGDREGPPPVRNGSFAAIGAGGTGASSGNRIRSRSNDESNERSPRLSPRGGSNQVSPRGVSPRGGGHHSSHRVSAASSSSGRHSSGANAAALGLSAAAGPGTGGGVSPSDGRDPPVRGNNSNSNSSRLRNTFIELDDDDDDSDFQLALAASMQVHNDAVAAASKASDSNNNNNSNNNNSTGTPASDSPFASKLHPPASHEPVSTATSSSSPQQQYGGNAVSVNLSSRFTSAITGGNNSNNSNSTYNEKDDSQQKPMSSPATAAVPVPVSYSSPKVTARRDFTVTYGDDGEIVGEGDDDDDDDLATEQTFSRHPKQPPQQQQQHQHHSGHSSTILLQSVDGTQLVVPNGGGASSNRDSPSAVGFYLDAVVASPSLGSTKKHHRSSSISGGGSNGSNNSAVHDALESAAYLPAAGAFAMRVPPSGSTKERRISGAEVAANTNNIISAAVSAVSVSSAAPPTVMSSPPAATEAPSDRERGSPSSPTVGIVSAILRTGSNDSTSSNNGGNSNGNNNNGNNSNNGNNNGHTGGGSSKKMSGGSSNSSRKKSTSSQQQQQQLADNAAAAEEDGAFTSLSIDSPKRSQ